MLGIDYLSIACPIEAPATGVSDPEHMDLIWYPPASQRPRLGFEVNGVVVDVWIRQTSGAWWAYLKCNPARHHTNSVPWAGLPPDMLPSVMADVWSGLSRLVVPLVNLEGAQIRRLDIARDFTLTAPERTSLLTGLSQVRVSYATRRSLHRDRRGNVRTLYVSTKGQGGVRAYDHHDHHDTSPEGTLRVEAQVHKDWARRYGGIETISDISPSAISDLYLNRFTWSAMGTPIVHEHARTEATWALTQDPDSGLTVLGAERLLGRERLREAGIDCPEGNSTSSARKALTGRLGVAHGLDDGPCYIRLDPVYDEPLRLTS